MEDNFYSYEKMPESLSKLGLDPLETKKMDKVKWAVTEKIHGANFSFLLDAKGIAYAKRKELLAWEDDFFGFQRPALRLEAALYRLYDELKSDFSDLQSAQLYGELFGGAYPHAAVPVIEGLQPIQTGLWYSPDIHFAAFDLAWIDSQEERHYLSYEQLARYCDMLGILYIKPLFVGTLHQALQFDTHIASALPQQLGMPELETFNLIEGIVVRPFEYLLVETPKGSIRPIVKIKNPEFSEDERFAEAQKWSYTIETDSDALLFFADELSSFLNKNRVASAISKIGRPDNSERKEQIRDLIWEDLLEAYENAENTMAIESDLLSALKRLMLPQIRTAVDEFSA